MCPSSSVPTEEKGMGTFYIKTYNLITKGKSGKHYVVGNNTLTEISSKIFSVVIYIA